MEDDAAVDFNYNLSFSGCGFLCIYHAGVIAAIKEYAPQLTKNKICGASAGAIAAAATVCNVCISKAVSTILSVVTQAHQSMFGPLDTNFHLIELVRVGLNESLPSDAHILCTNKLLISLTRVEDGRNVIVDRYDSKEELIQVIINIKKFKFQNTFRQFYAVVLFLVFVVLFLQLFVVNNIGMVV